MDSEILVFPDRPTRPPREPIPAADRPRDPERAARITDELLEDLATLAERAEDEGDMDLGDALTCVFLLRAVGVLRLFLPTFREAAEGAKDRLKDLLRDDRGPS